MRFAFTIPLMASRASRPGRESCPAGIVWGGGCCTPSNPSTVDPSIRHRANGFTAEIFPRWQSRRTVTSLSPRRGAISSGEYTAVGLRSEIVTDRPQSVWARIMSAGCMARCERKPFGSQSATVKRIRPGRSYRFGRSSSRPDPRSEDSSLDPRPLEKPPRNPNRVCRGGAEGGICGADHSFESLNSQYSYPHSRHCFMGKSPDW